MDKMEILVLGPVQAWASGRRLPLDGSITESLLAALAIDADRTVTLDTLTDTGWEIDPPRTVRRQIRNRLARLRRTLVEAGFPTDVIDTDNAGYMLRTQGIRLDLAEFRRMAQHGADVTGTQTAITASREALALWRGPAFAGLDSSRLLAAADQLAEQRLSLWEQCLSLELEAGQQESVIAELVGLHRLHPDRERFAGLLMLALYRCGRQADALAVFHTTRDHLAEDLGLNPSRRLLNLYQEILQQRPHLHLAAGPSKEKTSDGVPRELPREIPHFTGRVTELAQLDSTDASVVIVHGTAGLGKTTLAVQWAHRARERFPDGQLYINLRGFDPAGAVVTAAAAVRRFLDSLGVPVQRVPADVEAQFNLYRTLLAGKRMLVLLDNARDPDHVRPLLPGAPDCLALITSRNRMTGLVAAEGAHTVPLDLLTLDEARQLLMARFGRARAAAEPEAVDEIIELCARLPLALAIVSAHATGDSGRPLRAVAEHLRDRHDRLDALSTGDTPATDVRAVFSWSYRTLGDDAALLFRLLGTHPGPDISLAAAASLAAMPIERASAVLTELAGAHLLGEHVPGRYAFHDLLRAYAADLAAETDPGEHRNAATGRILDHYLHTANNAFRELNPHREPLDLKPPPDGVTPEEFSGQEQALDWFAAERAVLLATLNHAATDGWHTHAWQLAGTLWTFLDRRGHWHDLTAAQHAALTAAQRLADPGKQALAHHNLARAYTRLDHFDDAHAHMRHALELSGRAGDRAAQAETHLRIANIWERQGRHAEALDHSERSLELYRAAGQQLGQGLALNAIGWYQAHLGNHRPALKSCRQAITMLQELDNRPGQAASWDSLGYAHHRLGQHTDAIACLRRAVDLYHELGHQYYEAAALTNLGDSHHTAGDHDAARGAWRQALAILEQLDHPNTEQVRARLTDRALVRRDETSSRFRRE